MCDARSRAAGVTMRLRMPPASILTTGVCSKIPDARGFRKSRETVKILAAVDLECGGIVHRVEIAPRLQHLTHALDLPAFDVGAEILTQHLQPADELIADIDVGNLERAVAQGQVRTELLGGMADIGRAAARQRPQFARGVEADAGHDVADRQAISRHHRPERMSGGVPSDVFAFEDDNIHALARQFQRCREAGKPGADHTDVDIRIQCQTTRLGCVLHSRRGVGG